MRMVPAKRSEKAKAEGFNPQAGDFTLYEALRGHAFLHGLEESHVATLAGIAEPVRFRDRELILAEKQRSLGFFLLLSGSVSIELNKGHYVVRIQSLGPGDAFGWSAVLDHHDTLFDVRASDPCTALRLDGAALGAVLKEDPALAAELLRRTLRVVAGRVQATETRLGELCGVRMTQPERRVVPIVSRERELNKLIEICLDGELGYRTAAEHLHSAKLRIMLTDQAIRRAQFAGELRAEVERLGGKPSHSGSVAASLHRGWISLKSAISGADAKAIIAACQTGEDAARASYVAVLKSPALPGQTRSVIEAQRAAIDQSRALLQQIDEELSSGAQFLDAELGG